MFGFICYPPGVEGYCLYVLSTHDIFVSRNVVFHEIIFQFVSTGAPSTDPFVDLVIPQIQDDAATSLSSASSSPSSNAAPTPRHPIIQDASNDLTTQPPPSTIVSALNGPWRSTIAVSRPCFLQDFHCSLLNAPGSVPCTSPHSLDHAFSYDKISPSHWYFALSVSVNYEPQFTIKQSSLSTGVQHCMKS